MINEEDLEKRVNTFLDELYAFDKQIVVEKERFYPLIKYVFGYNISKNIFTNIATILLGCRLTIFDVMKGNLKDETLIDEYPLQLCYMISQQINDISEYCLTHQEEYKKISEKKY